MYKIVVTSYFKKQLKKLVKKDPGLKESLKKELLSFDKQKAVSLGSGVYKVRIAGLGKGKSGGYRSYFLVMEIQGILAPICIYAKNQQDNLTFEELTWHIRSVKEELNSLI